MTCTFCKPISATNYFLSGTTCVQTCPANQFGSISTPSTSDICSPCSVGCIGCTSAGYTTCTSCASDATSSKLWLAHGTTICDVSCPSAQYMGSGANDFQCLLCSSPCLTCTGTDTNCVTCNSPNLLHQSSPGVWTCIGSCPDGYYLNAFNPVCDKCPLGCANCTDGSTSGAFGISCTHCQTEGSTPYFLIVGTTICNTSCPNGQYSGSGASANRCVNCVAGCATCTAGTLNSCPTCG